MAARDRKVPDGTSAIRPNMDETGRPVALRPPTRPPAVEEPVAARTPAVVTAPAVETPAKTTTRPAASTPAAAQQEESVTPTAAVVATAEATPPPPPAVRRQSREQFNTKMLVDLRARLDAFVEHHNTTRQGVIECALEEYMTRRGWSADEYGKRKKRS